MSSNLVITDNGTGITPEVAQRTLTADTPEALRRSVEGRASYPHTPTVVKLATPAETMLLTEQHPWSDKIKEFQQRKPKWMIEGLLFENSISGLHGLEGSFKSFLIYQMSEEQTMGTDFLRLFSTLKPRSVGIYQSELGEESSVSRLSHLYPDGRLPVNLHISDEQFKAKVLKQLTLREQFKVIGEWIEDKQMADLKIDHIGPFLDKTGRDVNSESAARMVLDELARLRADHSTLKNITFIRHDGKPGANNELRESNQKMRGSNALVEEASFVIGMTRQVRPKPTNRVDLTFGKTRDAASPDNLQLWFDAATFRLTPLPPVIAILESGPLTRDQIRREAKRRFDLQPTTVDAKINEVGGYLTEDQAGHKRVWKLDLGKVSYSQASGTDDENGPPQWTQALSKSTAH